MNDEDAARLVPRFRQSGLLLDTNLLLVLIAGQHNPAWIGARRRLREYTANDLRTLRRFVARFDRLITTPAILGEVSNLAVYAAYDNERADFFATFRAMIAILAERYPHSAEVADLLAFGRLGLTDASIEQIAEHRHAFVLSDDFDLVRLLHDRDLPAINFNHLR